MERSIERLSRDAELLRAIAHPTRLALLEALCEEEECVCHLSTLLDKPQPYISKGLAELREVGLVFDRREGMRTYYRLADPMLRTLLDSLRSLTGRAPTSHPKRLPGCPCPRCSS